MKKNKSKFNQDNPFFLVFGIALVVIGWSIIKSNADGAYLRTTALSWGWGFIVAILGAAVIGRWIADNTTRK